MLETTMEEREKWLKLQDEFEKALEDFTGTRKQIAGICK